MKALTEEAIKEAHRDGLRALEEHPTWPAVRVYPQGFVPNSYRWPAPAERVYVSREGSHRVEKYDRKRAGARGSYIVRAT